jgi:hypothetical protein
MSVASHPTPIRLRKRRASVLPPLLVLAAAAGAALWMARSGHDGPDDPASAVVLVGQGSAAGLQTSADPAMQSRAPATGAGVPTLPLYGSLAALDRALSGGYAPRLLSLSAPRPAGLHQDPVIANAPGPLPGPNYTLPAQEPIDAALAAEAARPDEPATIVAALPQQQAAALDGEAGEDAAIAAASAGSVAAPLPPPRPAWLAAPAEPAPSAQAAIAPQSAQPARRARLAQPAAPVVATDNRSFLQKLFGGGATQGDALAYAAPQDDAAPRAGVPRLLSSPGGEGADAMTAVYDIAARTVYMPNGDKLEAHSGLGEHLDDPRAVHVRMKGPTPPHLYELREREALFHGVRAIRLNPVGGSGAIHGRAGLLAHTFMLGPRGDSNGCVSFRDYERFLQAYLRGEVKRLLVVAGRG